MSDAPPVNSFRTVGIVGAGRLGAQVAHWCAVHGYGVILCDSDRPAIDRGVAVIRGLFAEDVRQGRLTGAEAHKLTGGIGITTSLEDFEICDLIIEVIPEDLAAKQKLFAELSARVDPDCVLATGSAGLAVADIAAQASGPERIVGLRFPEPLTDTAIFTVNPHPATSPATLARINNLGRKSA